MFSKSQRFQDGKGRTPGPGDYDVKSHKKTGAASFPKGQRFSDSSDTESVGGCDSMLAAVKSKPEFKIPHTTRPIRRKPSLNKKSVTIAVQTDACGDALSSEAKQCTLELQETIEQHESKLTQLQEQLQAAESQHDILNQEKLYLESKMTSQKAELEETSRQKTASLRLQLDEKSSTLDQLQPEISSLTKLYGTLQESSDRLEADLAHTKKELTCADDKLRAALTNVKELEEQISQGVEEKNKLEKLLEVYKEKEAELVVQATNLTSEKDKLTERMSTLEHTITVQDDTICTLTTSLERETELRTSTEASVRNKNETITCMKQTIEQLQTHISEWEKLQTGSTERQSQLELQVSHTSQSLSGLTDQLQQLKLANKQSRSETETLQSEQLSSKQRISELECTVQTKCEEITQLTNRLGQAKQTQEDLRQKEAKIEELLDLNTLLSAKLDDHKSLRDKISSLEDIVSSMMSQNKDDISQYEVRLADARTELQVMSSEKRSLQDDLNKQLSCIEALKHQYSDNIVSLQTKLSATQLQLLEKESNNLSKVTTAEQERDEALLQSEKYQKLYEELQERIAPFKEQLDSYEMERKALEGQTKNWASEAAKATQEYAKLLGHQNQKQKIKRINQISEENMSLKQDVMNLRSSEAKLKRQLSQLQDKVRQVEGKRRFDPSKAFQSSENADTSMRQRTPLKVYNSKEN